MPFERVNRLPVIKPNGAERLARLQFDINIRAVGPIAAHAKTTNPRPNTQGQFRDWGELLSGVNVAEITLAAWSIAAPSAATAATLTALWAVGSPMTRFAARVAVNGSISIFGS